MQQSRYDNFRNSVIGKCEVDLIALYLDIVLDFITHEKKALRVPLLFISKHYKQKAVTYLYPEIKMYGVLSYSTDY